MYPILLLVTSILSGSLAVPARKGPAYQTDDYYTLDGIQAYLNSLARSYSHRVTLKEIGRTYENRSLTTITITNGDRRPGKNVIFIDAGIHAREWLTHTTALNIIDQLVVNYEENKELLQDYNWVVLPLFNPDGYHYSRSGMQFKDENIEGSEKDHPNWNVTDIIIKFWRKNRRPITQDCIGTDLNRNFDIGWGLEIHNHNPCVEEYGGPTPFSEPESRAVRRVLLELANTRRGKMYISFHSHNNSIMYPLGYDKKNATNDKEHIKVATAAQKAIAESFPAELAVKPSHGLYLAGGTSGDYAYKIGFPLSFTWELPGVRNGVRFEFHPPTKLIKEMVKETWIGVRAMAAEVVKMYPSHY